MCCLFGLVDYGHQISAKQKSSMIFALATACEARGTDATGIAYHTRGVLKIYKRPVPGHCLRCKIPKDTSIVMGHTRMSTQGTPRKNQNNHPFLGKTKDGPFALAHNGVLYNDTVLRKQCRLPASNIETDSYVAVQLIEQKKALNFDSLRHMAEQVEGSFTFSVLGPQDMLYLIKGDNPMCLIHMPSLGLYVYASTEEILKAALKKMKLLSAKQERISLDCGEILRITQEGFLERSSFDDSNLTMNWFNPRWYSTQPITCQPQQESYLDLVKSIASSFGYTPESIDRLAGLGFTPEELEEFLYCGEL